MNYSHLQILDALPFSLWHLITLLALSSTWILDGYEVSAISLNFKFIARDGVVEENELNKVLSAYMLGGQAGGLFFGLLSVKYGRKSLYFATLLVYLVSVLIAGFSYNLTSLVIGRFLTGVSVGGQYTVIFASIDELMPKAHRGKINIAVDGTWQLGAVISSLMNLLLGGVKWRLTFMLGLVGIVPLAILRKYVPQSPRWLNNSGRSQDSQKVVNHIKLCVLSNKFFLQTQDLSQQKTDKGVLQMVEDTFRIFKSQPRKVFVSIIMITGQAVFFSSVYYKYPIILQQRYQISQQQAGFYMIPLNVSAFFGTILFGPLYDCLGRRKSSLILFTITAILLAVSNLQMAIGLFQTVMVALFLVSSPAASSAHLTVSQIFPTRIRSLVMTIMFVFAMVGGLTGVVLGQNILLLSGLMLGVGLVAWGLGTQAAQISLQQINQVNQ